MRDQKPTASDSLPSTAVIPDEPLPDLAPLTEALESPENRPPAGARPDVAALQGLENRRLNNRVRFHDRFYQLPVYGEARKQASQGKARWKLTGRPSDHPLIQTLLALREDEDELVAMKSDMEPKEYVKLRLAIKSKVTDILLALQKESDQLHKETMDLIAHDQRQKEHDDKMSVARNQSELELSDAELIKRAEAAGIPLNGKDEE